MINALSLLAMSSFWLPAAGAPARAVSGAPDRPFDQEYRVRCVFEGRDDVPDLHALAIDRNGIVWAAAADGLYTARVDAPEPVAFERRAALGPVFHLAVDAGGVVWAAAWDGLHQCLPDRIVRIQNVAGPVALVCPAPEAVWALGPDAFYRSGRSGMERLPVPCARSLRAAIPDGAGGLWLATGVGLYHQTPQGITLYQTAEELLSADLYGLAFAPDGALWVGGLGGVTCYRDGARIGQFTPEDGLPSVHVRCVVRGPDGAMWVGADRGVARYDGAQWRLRHSARWLPDDEVRAIAFDESGGAWIATRGGISVLRKRPITLADKAAHYHAVCMARHVRDPYIVEKCRLRVPGDLTTWEPEDDDNDGGYTAVYMVMESLRYATTHNPEARANARKAFELLRFLQEVTETPGFVARTVIPADWTRMHDPNEVISDEEWAARRVRDPRQKRIENRWRPSRDGKWLWKGDTSSDEITAHMFGYFFYHELAADEDERKEVAALICRILDYIIDGGYVLRDIDGAHTRWAVWAPERLNGDPDWAPERRINSAEILSFLKLAHHVSGDARYHEQYEYLIREHGYAENARLAKTYAPAWRTHIDDELLAFTYPALLMLEKDPELLRVYRESLDHWYEGLRHDQSPFFNFIYGMLTGADPERDASLGFLRDAPLDLVLWTVDNSTREDIRLVRAPELEAIQTHRMPPPCERGVMRWDKNPWDAVQGHGGYAESDGVFWMFPYWMGRYCGYIQAP